MVTGESNASYSFNVQIKSGKMVLYSSPARNRHLCSLSLSSFSIFGHITFPPPLRPLCCAVQLFTAGLGYSSRRQAHLVSLLLRVVEKKERKKKKGWGIDRKQMGATAMLREEGGKQKKRKKILVTARGAAILAHVRLPLQPTLPLTQHIFLLSYFSPSQFPSHPFGYIIPVPAFAVL